MTRLKDALEAHEGSLFVDESVADILQKKQLSWRRVVTLSVMAGVMTAALAYMDTVRREKLPQNLVNVGKEVWGDG